MATDIVHVAEPTIDHATLERVLLKGDLADLTPKQRLDYYQAVCRSVGLNPLTQPLAYIHLNGKLVLYALRAATDQLRKIHNVSVVITSREERDGLSIVTARATMPSGRTDESVGAVWIAGLKGEALANAILKADSKARRRVTLAICGLSLLDETEAETIAGANTAPASVMHAADLPVNVVRLKPQGEVAPAPKTPPRAPHEPEEAMPDGGAVVEMFGGKLSTLSNEEALAGWCKELKKLSVQHAVRVVLWGMLRQHVSRLGLDIDRISALAQNGGNK